MEDSKFNIGDWVVVKLEETQFTGIITNKTELGYEVKDNNHYYQFVLEQYLERIDPKTAFLHDLSELLRKYDAKIDLGFAGHAGENPYINIALGDNGDIEWTDSTFYNKDFKFPLTADNVLNYDK